MQDSRSSQSTSSAAAAGISGIDLSSLTTVLCPPDQLSEPDAPWVFDRLLQQVAQNMQRASDEREAAGFPAGSAS
jgi:hypothetical protein